MVVVVAARQSLRQAAAGTVLEEPVSLLLTQTPDRLSALSHACLSHCHPKHSCTGSSAAVSMVPGSSGMARLVLALWLQWRELSVLNIYTQAYYLYPISGALFSVCGR